MSELNVKVCRGNSCSGNHSEYIEKRLQSDISFYKYGENVKIEECFCQGRCKEGPIVLFGNDVQTWQNPIKSSEILRKKVTEWKKIQERTNQKKESQN